MGDILTDVLGTINLWSWGVTKPSVVDYVWNVKIVDLNYDEYVLLYQVAETHKPFGLGAKEYIVDWMVSIDIRTGQTRERAIEIRDEIIKIFRTKCSTDKDFVVVERITDMSDELKLLFNFIIDMRYRKIEKL